MRFARIPASNPRPLRWRWILFTFLLILLLLLGAALYMMWLKNLPNKTHIKSDFGGLDKPIFYQGEMLKQPGIGQKEELKLPFDIIQKIIDPTMLYESKSSSVIITTQDKVIRLKTSQLTGVMNDKPFKLHFSVEINKDTVYLPIEPLRDFYNLNISESIETGAIFLHKEGDTIQWGKVIQDPKDNTKQYALRSDPTKDAPIYADLKQNEPIMIWAEKDGWYRAQIENGIMGYVQKSEVVLDHIEVIPKPEVKADTYVPWRPLGGKINLTWQQVFTKNPDTSKLPPMPGLNVISPQWFHLMDGQGNIKNLADAKFAQWAHTQGLQLWALFSNSFDLKQTTEALSTYDTRLNMIKQLVSFAQMYHLDGINIDFENVALKDKANMVQFVHELSPFLHEQGLVVSIDVTVKDGSDTYSKFMDRHAVKDSVDYMMIMSYDEHWSTSQTAGSVSSLPWVEKGITRIIEEDAVPATKILMGLPFYTRIWTEQGKVTSKAVSMEVVQNLIKDKKLTPTFDTVTGQNYVEYTEGNKKMKIWIEDAKSMQSRIELAKKLGLAGVASWSRSFETPDIWTVIQNGLEKRP